MCVSWQAGPLHTYRGPPSSSAGQGEPKKNGDLQGTYKRIQRVKEGGGDGEGGGWRGMGGEVPAVRHVPPH